MGKSDSATNSRDFRGGQNPNGWLGCCSSSSRSFWRRRKCGSGLSATSALGRAARGVERLVGFDDPWGNRHELFFGARSLGSFRPTREISGFVTGALGLGHVVFVLPDLEQAVDFFTRVMGFRLSDFIDVPFPLA